MKLCPECKTVVLTLDTRKEPRVYRCSICGYTEWEKKDKSNKPLSTNKEDL